MKDSQVPPLSQKSLLSPHIEPVFWDNGACVLLDQRALPQQETYVRCETADQVVEGIRSMQVRGAPAIGIAGAYGAVLAAKESLALAEPQRHAYFEQKLQGLISARPTAVNLAWAIQQMKQAWAQEPLTDRVTHRLWEESRRLHQKEAERNSRLCFYGAQHLPEGEILTYCNTGALATVGHGTALGVIYEAFQQKKVSHVYVCETRPLLQGLRLTAWELKRLGIPFTVICDNMAASVLRSRPVRAVIVGADRIAANADTANKIGTYGLAVLAKYHGVPFWVAAPSSTFDANAKTGADIPIEQRQSEEILSVLGRGEFVPPVSNPSFDVTPHELISAIVCEKGILVPPFSENFNRFLWGDFEMKKSLQKKESL